MIILWHCENLISGGQKNDKLLTKKKSENNIFLLITKKWNKNNKVSFLERIESGIKSSLEW